MRAQADDQTAPSTSSTSSTVTTIASGAKTFNGPGECRDTVGASAACAAGFTMDGLFYGISCGAVRADAVSDTVVAIGTYSGIATEVRQIRDVDPTLLLAIRRDGGVCGDGDRVLSPWSMLFPGDSTKRPEIRDAVCAATVEQHRERNQCA